MRVIIEPDYDKMSQWAADYVAQRIIEFNPTADKPFKLGCTQALPPTLWLNGLYATIKSVIVNYANILHILNLQ